MVRLIRNQSLGVVVVFVWLDSCRGNDQQEININITEKGCKSNTYQFIIIVSSPLALGLWD